MKASLPVKTSFVGPAIVWLLAFTIYPLIYSFGISFTNLNLADKSTGAFVGLRNYIGLFGGNDLFPRALEHMAIIMSVGISVQLVIGFVIARLFFVVRNSRGINILRTIYMIPIMITPIVFGLVSSYIFNPLLGIANYFFSFFGIGNLGWYGDPKMALWTIILMDAWQWTPLVAVILFSGLTSIPQELFENADVDGARVSHKIFYIELPMISRVVGIAIIMRLMDIMRMFGLVYGTTKGGPGGTTAIVSMYAYRQAFNYYNTGIGSAASILALIVTTLLSLALNRYIGGRQK